MTEEERAELEALRIKDKERTIEETERFKDLLRKFLDEVLYAPDNHHDFD